MRVQGHCANIFVGSELKQQKADIVDETDRHHARWSLYRSSSLWMLIM